MALLAFAGLAAPARDARADGARSCEGPAAREAGPAAAAPVAGVAEASPPGAAPRAGTSQMVEEVNAPDSSVEAPGEGAAARPAGKEAVAAPAASGWIRWNAYDGHCMTVRLHTRQMLDVTAFGQDAASVSQLGKIDAQFQWREARFMASGQVLCFERPLSYYVSVDFGGFDLAQGQRFGVSEFWLELPVNEWVGTVTVGKLKPRFSLEFLTSGGSLTFMERSLEAFYQGRQTGVIVANHAFGARLTWAAGFYADWLGGGTSTSATARVTGLPLYADGGQGLVHLGGSARWTSLPGGTAQFHARPATDVGPYFADTGAFTAGGSWGFDAELLAILGPVSLQAELLDTLTLSSSTADPSLWGYYVKLAWFPTGETLPYDRVRAVPTYVVPRSRWGAAEVAVRWFVNDLDGGRLQGGMLRDLQLGASWYIGYMFRLDLDYGRVWLARFGTTGVSDVYAFRLQFQI